MKANPLATAHFVFAQRTVMPTLGGHDGHRQAE